MSSYFKKRLQKWVFKRFPEADSLPHRLRRQRIYILPTKYGLMFSAFLIAMLLASVNNNNNLGLLLTFLLGSMLIVSIFHTHKNLSGLKILSIRSAPVFAGQDAVFLCHAQSASGDKNLISFQVLSGPPPLYRIPTENYSDEKETTVEVKTPAWYRGVLEPKAFIVATEFPFSFFKAWSYVRSDIQCIVYPKPIPSTIPQMYQSDAEESFDGASEDSRGSDDFGDLKTYRPGDSPKHIFWKGFSRGQGLHTKSFVGAQGKTLHFDFDALEEEQVEKKLSILTYCVLTASDKRLPFALSLPGKRIEAGIGERHREKALQALALYGIAQ